jgi:hypothetical protein
VSGDRELAARVIPLDQLTWFFPEEAARKLAALAQVAGLDDLGSAARPIPTKHRLDILGRLVRETILGGPSEELPKRLGRLETRDRAYLATFLAEALSDLRQRQRDAPSTPLGVPYEPQEVWANLLDRGWLPMPGDAEYPGRVAR